MYILYVKDDCPACNLVKQKASAAGLLGQIELRNIDKVRAFYDELVGMGARVVPVLVDPRGGVHVNHQAALAALGLR